MDVKFVFIYFKSVSAFLIAILILPIIYTYIKFESTSLIPFQADISEIFTWNLKVKWHLYIICKNKS